MAKGDILPPDIFLSKNFFFLLISKGQIKKLRESGGKGRVYIKDWFKPPFPLFLI